mgnify:CR=1 FL=1
MRVYLALLLLLSSLGLCASPTQAPLGLNARQLPALLQQPGSLLLDVRSTEEYAAGHLAGAINIPHDQLAARLAEVQGHSNIVLYCRSGRRVQLAAALLQQQQQPWQLYELQGNFMQWQAEKRPLNQGLEP